MLYSADKEYLGWRLERVNGAATHGMQQAGICVEQMSLQSTKNVST